MPLNESTTPLMSQYRAVKSAHPDEVLFFRLGDFYEMFDDDAVEVSSLLNLTLTSRVGSPMCGIPFHSSKVYIARLLRLGKKIALCEQIGTPSGKGITERKVTTVYTPGTVVDEEYLEQGAANYLAALWVCSQNKAEMTGFAYIDGSTASFFATSWHTRDMADEFARELGRSSPKEILLPESLRDSAGVGEVVRGVLKSWPGLSVSWHPDWLFSADKGYKKLCSTFGTVNLRAFGLSEESPEVGSAGFLLDYLTKNVNTELSHVRGIHVFRDRDYLIIDDASRRNLEIDRNLRDGGLQFTLFYAINHTRTAMGKRLLQNWLAFPLCDPGKIALRQDAVRGFVGANKKRQNVQETLAHIGDLERLASLIAMGKANPKQVVALRRSLESYLKLRDLTGAENSPQAEELSGLIRKALRDDPATPLTDGEIIREGWSPELDHLRQVKREAGKIMADYVTREKERTGINAMKLRDNHMIGYFLEVPKSKIGKVPKDFILRRTLVNADCYTTETLQKIVGEVSGAEERIGEEERRLFLEVCSAIQKQVPFLLAVSREIAFIDVTSSFAHLAVLHDYVCPRVDDSGAFEVTAGRHPVVEQFMPAGEFVPNDAALGLGSTFSLITGPNMAGKSTYLRQNALITLLTQVGSYVPAKKAHIGAADRIFCRVGASDNLTKGESTFLMEMTETALILRHATEKSLVIMDEVGRGTSTEDGLSIAWAVTEHLLEQVKCKTFFATHYHELTRIEHPALQLLCLDVLEKDGEVVFLKKIREGASANSYGIHVARLAGIPAPVINRARVLLAGFQREWPSLIPSAVEDEDKEAPGLFSEDELILDELASLNPDALTPLQALEKIHRWKESLSK